MTDDAALRQQFKAARNREPAERDTCIEADALAASAQRTDTEAARLVVLEHVATCAACRREFDLLRTVADTKPRAALRWARWGVPLAAAGAAALALVLWRGRTAPAEPSFRGPDQAITLHEPAIDSTMVLLAWSPVPGAGRYLLEIIAPDGTTAASRELSDTLAAIPRRSLPSAEEYRWSVQASLRDGRTVESAFRRLRLSR